MTDWKREISEIGEVIFLARKTRQARAFIKKSDKSRIFINIFQDSPGGLNLNRQKYDVQGENSHLPLYRNVHFQSAYLGVLLRNGHPRNRFRFTIFAASDHRPRVLLITLMRKISHTRVFPHRRIIYLLKAFSQKEKGEKKKRTTAFTTHRIDSPTPYPLLFGTFIYYRNSEIDEKIIEI